MSSSLVTLCVRSVTVSPQIRYPNIQSNCKNTSQAGKKSEIGNSNVIYPPAPPVPLPSTCLGFDSRCRAAVALVWERQLLAGGAGFVVVFMCV